MSVIVVYPNGTYGHAELDSAWPMATVKQIIGSEDVELSTLAPTVEAWSEAVPDRANPGSIIPVMHKLNPLATALCVHLMENRSWTPIVGPMVVAGSRVLPGQQKIETTDLTGEVDGQIKELLFMYKRAYDRTVVR